MQLSGNVLHLWTMPAKLTLQWLLLFKNKRLSIIHFQNTTGTEKEPNPAQDQIHVYVPTYHWTEQWKSDVKTYYCALDWALKIWCEILLLCPHTIEPSTEKSDVKMCSCAHIPLNWALKIWCENILCPHTTEPSIETLMWKLVIVPMRHKPTYHCVQHGKPYMP